MDASALVVLRCCGSDVAAFADALAAAMRAARADRHVIVEAAEGDVLWRPPAHAPTIAVRLVFVCGDALDPSRLRAPESSRPVHLTAVVVAPGGRDPAHAEPALALPRVFADVVGAGGAAAMLHDLLDGVQREEERDTDEWLAPGEGDDFGMTGLDDDGTAPSWPSVPEGASGLEEFRGAVPTSVTVPSSSDSPPLPPSSPRPGMEQIEVVAPRATPVQAPAPRRDADTVVQQPARTRAVSPARPAPEPTTPLAGSPPRSHVPPIPPPALPSRAPETPTRRRTAKAASPAATSTGTPASPAAKVTKRLKRLAGAVEELAASVVNDWILRAPPETPEGADDAASVPALAPSPLSDAAGVPRAPVALGVSAPRTAAPGAEFTARFIAHVPGRERSVAARLADPSADARSHPRVRPCQWAPGTAVTVSLRARAMRIGPLVRTFTWQGDEHVEEFDVTVPADTAPGTLVLTFDAAVDGFVVATLRLDLVVTGEAGARRARTSATTTAARTAFASYASDDRARVLDRLAAVRISAGLDVFVDGLSLHAGEAWQARLAAEIRQRDVFLLFWSASASASSEVAWEYRTAIETRGAEAVQVHPLEPDVRLPPELADQHAGDSSIGAHPGPPPRIDA